MIGNAKGARRVVGSFVCILGATILQGCDTIDTLSSGDGPAPPPPRNFSAFYYARAIHLSWELGFGWNGEPFRSLSTPVRHSWESIREQSPVS